MYESSNIAATIKTLAKEKGVVIKTMLAQCNLGSNTMSAMYHGKSVSAASLALIADYLGCSVDYLLGRDNLCKENAPGTDETAPEDEQEQELIRLARAADPVQRDVALQVLKMAVANERQATCKN